MRVAFKRFHSPYEETWQTFRIKSGGEEEGGAGSHEVSADYGHLSGEKTW